jgi:predicted nucleic acid-binding protein
MEIIRSIGRGNVTDMQKIYLDMNIYNRPYDDQTQVRIKLETIAIFEILHAMKSGHIHVLWSFILEYENSLNPYNDIRAEAEQMAQFTAETVDATEDIRQMTKHYESKGVKPRDALHVACAEHASATYFITCDDKLLKKQAVLPIRVKLLNPLDYCTGGHKPCQH